MSAKTASTLVLVTGGMLVAYAMLDSKNQTPEKTYKRIYSSFLATVALGIAADISPELVGPFCVLVLIAAWARHKGQLGGVISGNATPQSAVKGGKS